MKLLKNVLIAGALLAAAPRLARGEPAPPELDVLFVVDNSPGTLQWQGNLVAGFSRLSSALTAASGALPSLHVGVISSNVGVGQAAVANCANNGDDGELQSRPNGSCAPPTDRFISDTLAPDGTRLKNYTGGLDETFACIARLGDSGCGYEQHLESMRRALDGSQAMNAGFLRPDAYLLVVILADEDDCSAVNDALFDTSDSAEIGPFTSFRCTEFGIQCAEGTVTREAADYTQCVPRVDSPYLRHPDEYVEFLKGLKADPARVMVASIVGNPTPVKVLLDSLQRPQLEASCTSSSTASRGVPGVRLDAFTRSFVQRNLSFSVCDDMGESLAQIGALARQVIDGDAPPLPTPDAGPDSGVSDDGGPACGCDVGGQHEGSGTWGKAALALAALAMMFWSRSARRRSATTRGRAP